jgi:DNA-binding response OmpR family regulator
MKILLIEDDLGLGQALQRVLLNEGHAVCWIRMAAAAPVQLNAERYDLALLDLGLPDGDGVDILRTLRAQALQLPVLIISARDSLEQRLAGFEAGADDYLVKPFDIPELLARLRAVVRRVGSEAQLEQVWTVRGLRLDARGQSATHNGVELALSRTEFALLHALLSQAERVITRAELEASVLPASASQSLDVHMSNLRKKIGDGYIRTVRGVGYMVQHGVA